MNNIFIDGFLIADPEKRRTQKGTDVTTARIVHRDNADDPGMFISLVAWEGKADDLARYKKGELLNVFGRLVFRNWTDKAGNKRLEVEIVVEGVVPTYRTPKPKTYINPMDYAPRLTTSPPAPDPDYTIPD